jgi:hypothetical protein
MLTLYYSLSICHIANYKAKQYANFSALKKPERAINNGRRQTNKNTKCSGIFYSPSAMKLVITKRNHSTCYNLIVTTLPFNAVEERVGIRLTDLIPPHFCACPNLVPGFPTSYGMFCFFNDYLSIDRINQIKQ